MMLRGDLQRKMLISDLPDAAIRFVEAIGKDAAMKLIEAFGGERVYVPIMDSALKNVRNRLVCEEYNGHNLKELAAKYGCTRRFIYQIIQDSRSK